MTSATASGCETYTAWLPTTSRIVAPARFAMARCASGGIILSAPATTYQLHLVAQHRSFTRAADALFITPSGLSVLIREFELKQLKSELMLRRGPKGDQLAP
jgi:Bacterial regulatory helix-turn-helix protein, lysR family